MFKRVPPVLFAFTLFACSSPPEPETPGVSADPPADEKSAASVKWTVTQDIDAPESAYVDPTTGDVFVSLIDGAPDAKDGNGRIARIGADGTVKAPRWVARLNAPKGLRSHEGTLWTSDIDEIVAIEIATGKISSKVRVPGAQFLNDVAIGADGTVYVSDMLANKIYALKGGKMSVFAEGEDLEYPNGMLVEGDSIIVGGWGKPEADYSTKVPGRLYKLDLKTKMKTLITPTPTANIDGIESDGKGGYIASDWMAGKILRISANGKVDMLSQFMQGTADIGFIAADSLLIIPHMNENRVAAYDISAALK